MYREVRVRDLDLSFRCLYGLDACLGRCLSSQRQATSLAEVCSHQSFGILVIFQTPKLDTSSSSLQIPKSSELLASSASNTCFGATSALRVSTSETSASGSGEIGRMLQWLISLHCNAADVSLHATLPPNFSCLWFGLSCKTISWWGYMVHRPLIGWQARRLQKKFFVYILDLGEIFLSCNG